MVQKMLITLEIDDSALDAAQAKADKLIATLKEAERLMTPAVPEPSDVCELWLAAFEKGLIDMPPPEGGNPLRDEAERQFAQKFVQRMFQSSSRN